ncbi:MAG TPA: hypothetical protein EYP22_08675 [Methanosarcinales archaeon]|nr:hypothetical protein [Methanosarcinales archaeon]
MTGYVISKVRRLLNTGLAKVVKRIPFTIKLFVGVGIGSVHTSINGVQYQQGTLHSSADIKQYLLTTYKKLELIEQPITNYIKEWRCMRNSSLRFFI